MSNKAHRNFMVAGLTGVFLFWIFVASSCAYVVKRIDEGGGFRAALVETGKEVKSVYEEINNNE
tara:strand:- start:2098 stop:2289 length:192 start_codon:yes stop_codon:yes gene_type:complete